MSHPRYVVLLLALLTSLLSVACEESRQPPHDAAPHAAEKAADEIVTATAMGSNGEVIQMRFNNTLDTATVFFGGQTIELTGQKPAAGIWYANSQYELRGKGGYAELKKDGVVIATLSPMTSDAANHKNESGN